MSPYIKRMLPNADRGRLEDDLVRRIINAFDQLGR